MLAHSPDSAKGTLWSYRDGISPDATARTCTFYYYLMRLIFPFLFIFSPLVRVASK